MVGNLRSANWIINIFILFFFFLFVNYWRFYEIGCIFFIFHVNNECLYLLYGLELLVSFQFLYRFKKLLQIYLAFELKFFFYCLQVFVNKSLCFQLKSQRNSLVNFEWFYFFCVIILRQNFFLVWTVVKYIFSFCLHC